MTTLTYHMTTEYDVEFSKQCDSLDAWDWDYDRLVELFGEPVGDPHSPYKSRVEWQITFDIGGEPLFVCIYDWKEYDTPVEEVPTWSVSSSNGEAARSLLPALIKGE